jgi:hypothetical protein
MKKLLLSGFFIVVTLAGNAQQNAYDTYMPGDQQGYIPLEQPALPKAPSDIPGPGFTLLYDNGPLVTNPGAGPGGSDISAVQTSLGLSTFGFGHQVSFNYWVADDFTVPAGGWNIAGFGFYAYQTGSTTTSTINDVRFIIYDGDPFLGANIIYGDNTTNRLSSTAFTNIYRTLDTDLQNTMRPIMHQHCLFDLYLAPGTYWVAWQTGGDPLLSGPWCPPVTLPGQTITGNGLQYITAWGGLYDSFLATQQAAPFQIYGKESLVPVSNWALLLGIGLILTFAVIRFRRMA